MPELPDIEVYLTCLRPRLLGKTLTSLRFANPFLLRTVEPSPNALVGKEIIKLRRLGKRVAIGCENDLWLVLHLMIAGRLHWKPPSCKIPAKYGLLALDVADGALLLTEAGSKRRASAHIVQGETALHAHDPGGIDVLSCTFGEFSLALQRENHTLKRVLTDPQVLSGIGNSYSDEILHRARLSPLQQSRNLKAAEINILLQACRDILAGWLQKLREEVGDGFPEKVTAFRPDMAVHGRFGLPCPVCQAKVQRIVYAEHETNYCAKCQTDGRLLADRAMSKLLHGDWPKQLAD